MQAPGYSQSYNRYSYVWNNPLGMTDPTGYFGSAGGAADARSSTPGGTFGRDGNRPKFKLSLGRLVSQAGSGRGRIAGVDGSNPASGRSTVSGVVTSGTWNGDKKELTITGKVFNNISIEAFVNAMISGAEAGSLVNNQGTPNFSNMSKTERAAWVQANAGKLGLDFSNVDNINLGYMNDRVLKVLAGGAPVVCDGPCGSSEILGDFNNGELRLFAGAFVGGSSVIYRGIQTSQGFVSGANGLTVNYTSMEQLVHTFGHELAHSRGIDVGGRSLIHPNAERAGLAAVGRFRGL